MTPSGGRSPVDFDLVEALRLRALGWSNRRIARQMNNVSRETVRTRILDYEAQFRVATPEPVCQPSVEPIQAPTPAPKSPVMPVQEPKPAPVPIVPLVAPPPEPSGLDTVPPGCRAFFLVNGEQNAILARNCAQIAVGIEQWHPSYASLPAFRDADRFWVVINSDDDNVAFLKSIVEDIGLRERCLISRGDSLIGSTRWTWVHNICKGRLLMQREHLGGVEAWWGPQFEAVYHFIPLPAPNCVREIVKLLEPPPEPEKPIPFDGGYGAPYRGCPPQADNVPPQRGDRSCGFAF